MTGMDTNKDSSVPVKWEKMGVEESKRTEKEKGRKEWRVCFFPLPTKTYCTGPGKAAILLTTADPQERAESAVSALIIINRTALLTLHFQVQ